MKVPNLFLKINIGFIILIFFYPTIKVKVFDIRPLNANTENVKFTQWDINRPNSTPNDVAKCVSCLHTLEHIGLGRYGDKLDPDGWKKAFKSLVDLVAQGGGVLMAFRSYWYSEG